MKTAQKNFLNFINVSCETIHRLSHYEKMLISWNEKFNLIARSTAPEIWGRHFLDSAQLMKHIPQNARTLADMGAGAGFPGLVLAMLAEEQKRDLKIYAIESTRKKADFLNAVVKELKLNVVVQNSRVEDTRNLKTDVITARALTALPKLLEYANHLKKNDTVHIFLKGKRASEELTEARKYWKFDLDIHPSLTDESGRVLILKNLAYKNGR